MERKIKKKIAEITEQEENANPSKCCFGRERRYGEILEKIKKEPNESPAQVEVREER